MCRKKSVGINDIKYYEKEIIYRIFDVGGQRAERKKWQVIMKNVNILVYVISLSDYQEVILEDGNTNAMIESLEVFKEIINGEVFTESQIILFFNKDVLFKSQITEDDKLSLIFGDYKGGKNYEEAKKFIIDKFLKIFDKKEKYTILVGNAINDETVFQVDTITKVATNMSLKKEDPDKIKE